MIQVHETFVCKPGNASKLAKKVKEAMAGTGAGEPVTVLTDLTGQFNRVIMITHYESISAYEKNWEKYKADPAAMKKMEAAMAGYQDMYLTGSREIFQIW